MVVEGDRSGALRKAAKRMGETVKEEQSLRTWGNPPVGLWQVGPHGPQHLCRVWPARAVLCSHWERGISSFSEGAFLRGRAAAQSRFVRRAL